MSVDMVLVPQAELRAAIMKTDRIFNELDQTDFSTPSGFLVYYWCYERIYGRINVLFELGLLLPSDYKAYIARLQQYDITSVVDKYGYPPSGEDSP